jgi:hypothetical protein
VLLKELGVLLPNLVFHTSRADKRLFVQGLGGLEPAEGELRLDGVDCVVAVRIAGLPGGRGGCLEAGYGGGDDVVAAV